MGLNTNISQDGRNFHVQTEDWGPDRPQIVTHVFADGGRVIGVARIDYTQHLAKPNLPMLLPSALKAHHTSVVNRVRRGEFQAEPRLCLPGKNELTDIPHSGVPECPECPVSIVSTVGFSPTSGVAFTSNSVSEPHHDQPDDSPESAVTLLSDDRLTRPVPTEEQAQCAWDRIVGKARRERQVTEADTSPGEGPAEIAGVAPPPTHRSQQLVVERPNRERHSWDLVVESAKRASAKQPNAPVVKELLGDPALAAFEAGLASMRGPDKAPAVTHLARAVELAPANKRYRDALRCWLDWMDQLDE